ncbi:hypothetical protein OC846_002531 [Tilletia horrida]|uniref:Uncharacterized protein n=1 Tax=Tilletia horrida TaxID=155126 RepID=A0AAN6GTX2_9BASI|nr:hypothetical protein OC846_002531 [Tilletia horrida]KAK0554107.1 hypothetical protein OC845_000921 [Tilletia horrida]
MSQISTTVSTYILSKFARQDLNPAAPEQGLTWSFFDKPALVVKLYRTTSTPGPYHDALAQLGVTRQGQDPPSSMRLEVEWQVDNSVGSSQTQSGESPYSVLCLQKLDFDSQAAAFVGIKPRSELPLKATYQIDMVGFRYIDSSLGAAGPYRRFQLKFPNRADMFRFLGEIEHVCPCAEAVSAAVPAEKAGAPAPGKDASNVGNGANDPQCRTSTDERPQLQDKTNLAEKDFIQPQKAIPNAACERSTADPSGACQNDGQLADIRIKEINAAANVADTTEKDVSASDVEPVPVNKRAKPSKKKSTTSGPGDDATKEDVAAEKPSQKQKKTAAKPKAKPKARAGRQTAEAGVQAGGASTEIQAQDVGAPSAVPSTASPPRPPVDTDPPRADCAPLAPNGPLGPLRMTAQLTLGDLELPPLMDAQERLRWMSQSEISTAFEELLNSAWRDVTVGQMKVWTAQEVTTNFAEAASASTVTYRLDNLPKHLAIDDPPSPMKMPLSKEPFCQNLRRLVLTPPRKFVNSFYHSPPWDNFPYEITA